MARLTKHVTVQDDSGVIHSFGPDDDVPEWARNKITNPAAWEDGDAPSPVDTPAGAPLTGPVVGIPAQQLEDRIVSRVLDGVGELLRDLVAVVEDGDDEPVATSAVPGPPPKAGRGSGEDKWRAYAAAQGVDVTGVEDRNDIIAALQKAGVAVE